MKRILFILQAILVLSPNMTIEAQNPWEEVLITRADLNLNFQQPQPALKLDFSTFNGSLAEWKAACLSKFTELIAYKPPEKIQARLVKKTVIEGVEISAWIMAVSEGLSIHAYILKAAERAVSKSAVMAIHGHGRVEPAIGVLDDYHHKFAWELARDGHLVIAPELRGFSQLNNLAAQDSLNCLDYWEGRYQFTLATDAFLYGKSMVGETVEDLIRWENWFCETFAVKEIDVCGISYGGDLAVYYPVFSPRTKRIFCSGSMGSFSWIFRSCYNAPAHCIPGVLNWMDRAEIAGLNHPTPILIHYGELDTPGNGNASAAYNPSGYPAYEELVRIYKAFGTSEAITWQVSKNSHHEMDIPLLLSYFE